MKSLILKQSEVTVLFNLMNAAQMIIGMETLPEVSIEQQKEIIEYFKQEKVIAINQDEVYFDQFIGDLLIPMVKANKILLYNYGINKQVAFNTSLYFSKDGIRAISRENKENLRIFKIESINELNLFLPNILKNSQLYIKDELFVSYWLITKQSVTLHTCTMQNENANIIEQTKGKELHTFSMSLTSYLEKYNQTIKECLYETSN